MRVRPRTAFHGKRVRRHACVRQFARWRVALIEALRLAHAWFLQPQRGAMRCGA